MIFSAVLDANVLYPFSVRDTLLRLAELELYRPLWSSRVLEEMREALLEHGVTVDRAERLVNTMREAFEEAEVDEAEIERLEPAMTNDPGDRHVLACAVAADSEPIVTSNLAHFPSEACEPVGVEARHPDNFLLDSSISLRRESARRWRSRPRTSTRRGRSTSSSVRSSGRAYLSSSRRSERSRLRSPDLAGLEAALDVTS